MTENNETAEDTAATKTSAPTRATRWLYVVLCMVLTIAVTVTITAAQTRKAVLAGMTHYHETHHAHKDKIVVFDLQAINQGFIEKGANSRTALRAINALISLFDHEGYLIINADSTFAVPSHLSFITDEYQNLIDLAEGQGLDIDEGVDDSVRAAEQFMQMLNSL